MIYNVQGIATSFKIKNVAIFATQMRVDISKSSKNSVFEYAISSEIGDNEIFVTEMSNGTILTVGNCVYIDEILLYEISKNGRVLSFIISESSNIFTFDYYKNGELIRSVQKLGDDNFYEVGDPFEIEETETDYTEIIFRLIQDVAGDSFDTFALDNQSDKYTIRA
jgi:hypothetical protein